MVNKNSLRLRMLIVGSMLFTLYAGVLGVIYLAYGGSQYFVGIAAVGIVGFILFQYKVGKWSAIKSVGAEDLPNNYTGIDKTVEQLSDDMGISKPRIMLADMGVPNAFAVGRKGSGTIVLSRELLAVLDDDEAKGVIAHELAHIKNRDSVTMVLGQSIGAIVGMVVQYLVIMSNRNIAGIILASILGGIAQFIVSLLVIALSRYREYVADRTAADYTNQPRELANALRKISDFDQSKSRIPEETSSLAIDGVGKNLLRTHPPIEKRIRELENMDRF